MINLLTVVGARPQFIKASAFSLAIREKFTEAINEEILHTGQHYDSRMSNVFFDELEIPRPTYSLEPVLGGHAEMTGSILTQIGEVLEQSAPDLVVVYGDTNSTLAGALAAVKMGIPVAHIEAGMRSRNFRMPEEINRVLVDRISALNFAPSTSAISNLLDESLGATAIKVGDIVADVVRRFSPLAKISNEASEEIGSKILGGDFVLATLHRQETTDIFENLSNVIDGLNKISESLPVVLPAHPRLVKQLGEFELLHKISPNLRLVSPVGFLDMLALISKSSVVMTDSGGLQKEAFYMKTPCVTVRSETEWTETIELGWNRLSIANSDSIFEAFMQANGSFGQDGQPYGNGDTSEKILEEIISGSWRSYFN